MRDVVMFSCCFYAIALDVCSQEPNQQPVNIGSAQIAPKLIK